MLKKVITLLLAATVFFSCENMNPIKRTSNDGLMFAMIYDFDNTPVNTVAVYIDGNLVVESDIQGRFILENIRRGEYTIKLTKSGYETIEEAFYYDQLNVLYFKMINSSQLMALAETALDNREYNNAEQYINRALVLEPHRPDILFLKSIVYYFQGKNREAIIILQNLIRNGNNERGIVQLLEILMKDE